MAFEQVFIVMPDGSRYGPAPWQTLVMWVHERRVPALATIEDSATGQRRTVASFPDFAALAGMPPAMPADDPLASVIPYRNGPALVGYYLAVFSLIPCLGAFLGVAAFFCGIAGLKRVRAYPQAKGTVHAWIGIVLGGVLAIANIAAIVLGVIGIISSRR